MSGGDPLASARRHWRAAVWVALGAGCGAAALELLVLGIRKFLLAHMVYTWWQTLWTTPVSYLLFMLPIGLAVAAGSRLLPTLVKPRVIVFAPTWVAAFSVLFLFTPPLHVLAALVLSVGVAVALSRALAADLAASARIARTIVAATSGAIVLAAAVVHGGAALAEKRNSSSVSAADSGAPSVLLLVLDAVRAQNVSVYGYQRATTPVLERLAATGVTFRHAYATAPWTLPSHATLFTGRYPHELTAGWESPLQADVPTLAGVLGGHGYATGGFVANVAYCGRETGIARGFAHYEDYPVTPGEFLEASSLGRIVVNNPRLRALAGYHDIPGRRTARDIGREFLDWQRHAGARPFFAFLNFYDAHEPYLFVPRTPGVTSGRRLDLIRMLNGRMAERAFKGAMPEEERRAEEAAYDDGIAAIDQEIGILLDTLERRGRLANTIVIVVGDHGEQFGEHGLFSHGNSLYLPSLHVPLIVSYPRARGAGASSEPPVTLRDIAATILALTGSGATLPGRPLLDRAMAVTWSPSPVLAEVLPAPNQDRRYPAAHGPMTSVIDGAYQYIDGPGEREELFALTDTAQSFNRARPGADSLLARYRAARSAAAAIK